MAEFDIVIYIELINRRFNGFNGKKHILEFKYVHQRQKIQFNKRIL